MKNDWKTKKLLIENNRPLNRWILRLSYLIQVRQRILITQIELFNQNDLDAKQWRSSFIYLIQSTYQEQIVKTVLFERKDLDLLLTNVDCRTLANAKKNTWKWFNELPETFLNLHGIKKDLNTFNHLLADNETNQFGVRLPRPKQTIIDESNRCTKEWFEKKYDEYTSLMYENHIKKDDFNTLLNMVIGEFEFLPDEQLEVTFW